MTSSRTILHYFKAQTEDKTDDTGENPSILKRQTFSSRLNGESDGSKPVIKIVSPENNSANEINLEKKVTGATDDVFLLHHGDSVETNSVNDLPYYLNNFVFVLKSVIEDDHFKTLFNDVDRQCVSRFHSLSDKCQKLYVRLFQRNHKWLRHSKIKYPQISDDLTACLTELVENGFLDSGEHLEDLNDGLQMLSLNDIKSLAKEFKVKGSTKKDIITSLQTLSSQYKPLFSNHRSSCLTVKILKRVKEILGPCCKLNAETRSCFIRVLLLFNLPVVADNEDDPLNGQTKLILLLLRVDQGQLIFPDYEVFRTIPIFSERDSLLRYEEAKSLEHRLLNAVLDKNLNEACDLYATIRENYDQLVKNVESRRDLDLPTFLRRFTAMNVYVRCLSQAVEVFQKMKRYDRANEILRTVLDQKLYCQEYRGRWWDRLALNLDQHLKKKSEALTEICKALEEELTGEFYVSLVTRGHNLSKAASTSAISNTLPILNLKEAPKVEILGKLLNHNTSRVKSAFLSSCDAVSDSGDTYILTVEQLALQHYRENGFSEGIHGESSTIFSLYFLLFWDIIYKSGIPNVFQNAYQMYPLDIKSDHFYNSRLEDITSFLLKLQNMTEEDLLSKVKLTWETHKDKASLVAWDLFTGIDQVQGLVKSIGSSKLAGICKKLATDFRHYKSGVPDLLVWEPKERVFKFVEVKGPTDRLSIRQRLWIDYLLSIDVDVEVCHVVATGAKRLKRD